MNRLRAQGIIKMADMFGRYKREEPHIVRQFDSTATAIGDLRKRIEMLRALDPEKAKTMIEVRKDLNFFQAVEVAQKEGKLIVPHDVHDRILTETKDMEFLKQLYNYWVWTGTIAIYEVPDRKFKDKVVFEWRDGVNYSISFSVPEQFRSLRNCALLIDYPDFELINLGNNNYELKADEIHLIQHFPRANDYYNYDERFRIPVGEAVAYREDNTIRHLWRVGDSYIGSVVRDDFVGFINWRDFVADVGWSDVSGVALF